MNDLIKSTTQAKYVTPYSTNTSLATYNKSIRAVIFPWLARVEEVLTDEPNKIYFDCSYYPYGSIQHPQNLKLFGPVSSEIIEQNSIIKPDAEITKGTVFIIESHVAQNSEYMGDSFWLYYFFNEKDMITSKEGNTYYKLMLQRKLSGETQQEEVSNNIFGIEHILGLNKL